MPIFVLIGNSFVNVDHIVSICEWKELLTEKPIGVMVHTTDGPVLVEKDTTPVEFLTRLASLVVDE